MPENEPEKNLKIQIQSARFGDLRVEKLSIPSSFPDFYVVSASKPSAISMFRFVPLCSAKIFISISPGFGNPRSYRTFLPFTFPFASRNFADSKYDEF